MEYAASKLHQVKKARGLPTLSAVFLLGNIFCENWADQLGGPFDCVHVGGSCAKERIDDLMLLVKEGASVPVPVPVSVPAVYAQLSILTWTLRSVARQVRPCNGLRRGETEMLCLSSGTPPSAPHVAALHTTPSGPPHAFPSRSPSPPLAPQSCPPPPHLHPPPFCPPPPYRPLATPPPFAPPLWSWAPSGK